MKLCEEFYSSHATMRPFDAAIAEKTFQRVVDHHENLWGYLIFEKEDEPAAGYGLLTTYWCNEEGGNVLLLDEPTNHLDSDAKAELRRALQAYRGAVLLVCHEPEFYEGIVGEIWNIEEYSLLF